MTMTTETNKQILNDARRIVDYARKRGWVTDPPQIQTVGSTPELDGTMEVAGEDGEMEQEGPITERYGVTVNAVEPVQPRRRTHRARMRRDVVRLSSCQPTPENAL